MGEESHFQQRVSSFNITSAAISHSRQANVALLRAGHDDNHNQYNYDKVREGPFPRLTLTLVWPIV